MRNLWEFFEGGDNKHLSMMRLTVFLSFFPASWVVVVNPSDTSLGLYLGAYVGGLVGGKYADVSMKKAQNGNSIKPSGAGKR